MKPRVVVPLNAVSVIEGKKARLDCTIVGQPEPEVIRKFWQQILNLLEQVFSNLLVFLSYWFLRLFGIMMANLWRSQMTSSCYLKVINARLLSEKLILKMREYIGVQPSILPEKHHLSVNWMWSVCSSFLVYFILYFSFSFNISPKYSSFKWTEWFWQKVSPNLTFLSFFFFIPRKFIFILIKHFYYFLGNRITNIFNVLCMKWKISWCRFLEIYNPLVVSLLDFIYI